jgi:hypothetical protein
MKEDGLMTTDLTGGIDIDREYVLAQCPQTPGTRDAVNVWIENRNGAFGMRIGIEALAPKWDTHEFWLDVAFPNGRVFSAREHGETHPALGPKGLATVRGAGPLRFRCVEPFRIWTVSFDGPVPEITTTDLIRQTLPPDPRLEHMKFEIEMTMAVPPWVPGSLLPEAGRTLSSGVEGEFISPRYEQLFQAKGTMRVGDERFDVNGNGLRIRRQGLRKFEGFWGHCWQSALFPSGQAFGYNTYPPRPDGKPSYNEGYVFDGRGKLRPARAVQIPWLTQLVPSGGDVSLVLETEEGLVTIQGETFVNTRSRGSAILPPDFPIVEQAHARYRWDGEDTCGMVERSSSPSKMTLART